MACGCGKKEERVPERPELRPEREELGIAAVGKPGRKGGCGCGGKCGCGK